MLFDAFLFDCGAGLPFAFVCGDLVPCGDAADAAGVVALGAGVDTDCAGGVGVDTTIAFDVGVAAGVCVVALGVDDVDPPGCDGFDAVFFLPGGGCMRFTVRLGCGGGGGVGCGGRVRCRDGGGCDGGTCNRD
jgi:hypothetical protein